MRDRPCRLEPAGCRRRYSSHTPSAASAPLPRATSPGMIQRLASWAAAGMAGWPGGPATAGADTCGWVTGGVVADGAAGAGVVVGDAAAGPTDPDRVTVSPAATELGLTWMAAGGVVGAARTPTVPPPRGDPPQRR